MADNFDQFFPDWTTGTLTIASGSKNFTATNAQLNVAPIRSGDTIITPSGLTLIIASINANGNGGTLFFPAPAAAAGTFQTCIRFQSDNSRYTGAVAALVKAATGGNLMSLAGLALNDGDYLRASGAGVLSKKAGAHLDELADLVLVAGDYLRTNAAGKVSKIDGKKLDAFSALQAADRKLPFFTGADSLNLADFTAYAQLLLAQPNAVEMYARLGVVPNAQVPDRLREISPTKPDANQMLEFGCYAIVGTEANLPSTQAGFIVPMMRNNLYGRQVWYQRDGSRIYSRNFVNGVWSAWSEIGGGVQSLNGWLRLASGTIIQWGRTQVTNAASSTAVIPLVTTFPNGIFTAFGMNADWNVTAARTAPFCLHMPGTNASQLTFAMSGLASAQVTVSWFAIGT